MKKKNEHIENYIELTIEVIMWCPFRVAGRRFYWIS